MSILERIKNELLKERIRIEKQDKMYAERAEKIKPIIGDSKIFYHIVVFDFNDFKNASERIKSEDYITFIYDGDTLIKTDLIQIDGELLYGYTHTYKPKLVKEEIENYCFNRFVIHVYKYEIQ